METKLIIYRYIFCIIYFCFFLFLPQQGKAQKDHHLGGIHEPVRILSDSIDMSVHHGGLRPIVGVENIQVLRANRTRPNLADNLGWTYNHAPMLAYWNKKFYLQYLSNPFAEHVAPGQTLISTSSDGRNWNMPEVVFPIYLLRPGPIRSQETGVAMMHQRMGFYVAPNGRLLVLGFYGHAPNLWGEGGIGRVVREAYTDGSYGPIYFIRYNKLSNYNENNTSYPFYKESDDIGFKRACEELLNDKLKTMQWWEEDRSTDGFYSFTGKQQAPSVYHRKDGIAVVHWKSSWSALSSDEGKSWSNPVRVESIITDGAKTWGQRMLDDRFALVYNPAPYGSHRWPLALVTSDDGILFENMLLVHGEVPPRRYFGRAKDFGPQYVRGISEGNGVPPNSNMWVTYSVNKEDIWISRIPVPIRYKVIGPVEDFFEEFDVGGIIGDWNIYRTKWATAEIVTFPNNGNKSLKLKDRDPYDYTKAVRVFEESSLLSISFKIYAQQLQNGRLEVEILNNTGLRPISIVFNEKGNILVNDGDKLIEGGAYKVNFWHQAQINLDVKQEKYDLIIDGKKLIKQANFAAKVESVERVSFRTGKYRTNPTRQTDRYEGGDLPDSDDPSPTVIFYIDEVIIK